MDRSNGVAKRVGTAESEAQVDAYLHGATLAEVRELGRVVSLDDMTGALKSAFETLAVEPPWQRAALRSLIAEMSMGAHDLRAIARALNEAADALDTTARVLR
jgi:hypothetical protein